MIELLTAIGWFIAGGVIVCFIVALAALMLSSRISRYEENEAGQEESTGVEEEQCPVIELIVT
jgi:hypothetical protein